MQASKRRCRSPRRVGASVERQYHLQCVLARIDLSIGLRHEAFLCDTSRTELSQVDSTMAYCSKCGSSLDAKAIECTRCGYTFDAVRVHDTATDARLVSAFGAWVAAAYIGLALSEGPYRLVIGEQSSTAWGFDLGILFLSFASGIAAAPLISRTRWRLRVVFLITIATWFVGCTSYYALLAWQGRTI